MLDRARLLKRKSFKRVVRVWIRFPPARGQRIGLRRPIGSAARTARPARGQFRPEQSSTVARPTKRIFCRLAESQSCKNCYGRLKKTARRRLEKRFNCFGYRRNRMNRVRRAKMRRSDSGAAVRQTWGNARAVLGAKLFRPIGSRGPELSPGVGPQLDGARCALRRRRTV